MTSFKNVDTLTTISESLSENPRLNFGKWNTAILQWALEHSINGFDLSGLLLTEAEWTLRNPPIDAVAQPRCPPFPARLAANANIAANTNWKYDNDLAASAKALCTALKGIILATAGAAIDREYADPIRGHIDHEIHQIMAFIKLGYGTVNEADIKRLKEDLIIDTTKSWRDNVGKFKAIFTQLEPVGLFTTDFDKRAALDNAIDKTQYAHLLAGYKNETPNIGDRTFDAESSYIELRESNISASAVGFAGSVESSPAFLAISAELASMKEIVSTIAAASIKPAAPANYAGQGGRGGRGGRDGGRNQGRGAGRGGGGRGFAQPVVYYCFEHGYHKGHMGTTCRNMAIDPSYTQAMKDATGPCKIGGYDGHV